MNDQPVILYVEDDPASRTLMSMLLKNRLGLSQVTILEDSADFLARVEALNPKPSLVFLDIQVKPYSGFEMLTMLQQLPWAKTIPIVALTASVMNEEVEKLRTAGFNGCLAKPINLTTFPEAIECIRRGETVWGIVA